MDGISPFVQKIVTAASVEDCHSALL